MRLHREAPPQPARDEVLIEVTSVGLCGSDLHWYRDGHIGDAVISGPLVLGHEVGAVVSSGALSGVRVAVDPAHPCGRCNPCRAGHDNLCPNIRFLGHDLTDGGLRQVMTWPSSLLAPVPDSIIDDEVPLLEPLGVALHALDMGHVRAGMSAGVFGCGPIGLLLLRALRAAGLGPLFATDVLPHRVEAAAASGADSATLVRPGEQPAELGGWDLLDVVFEAAGDDAALGTALRSVRIGGRVVIVGIPHSGSHTLDAGLARRKGLSVILSRRMKAQHLRRAIDLVKDGHVELSGLVTERHALSQAPAAFEALVRRSGTKIIVVPSS